MPGKLERIVFSEATAAILAMQPRSKAGRAGGTVPPQDLALLGEISPVVVFSWLAALSLDLACLRRFLPWIAVLSFDLVLRFIFFLARGCLLAARRLVALSGFICLLFLWGLWRARARVCARAPSRARALA
jgi:hypothetical protein